MSLQSLSNISSFAGMEFGIFKLKDGVSEIEMLKAADAADKNFLSKEDGFLGHAVLKGKDGLYVDLSFATTKEKAEEICGKWMNNKFTLQYIEFIEPGSIDMSFWEKIK
ncbi:hypothetical protein MNBD_GAMMA17-2290 [hydrothermal vent metagenome]|uniref:Uncharacterized protein n=1 Tax=hydrothermal vent metagenome TaxID=652676 RepID=A0A3B0ZRE8_9ZZZZ